MAASQPRHVAERRLGRSSSVGIGSRSWLATSSLEVWTKNGLQRVMVLFFMELSTRRVQLDGITSVANGLWMAQIARNFTDGEDGFSIKSAISFRIAIRWGLR